LTCGQNFQKNEKSAKTAVFTLFEIFKNPKFGVNFQIFSKISKNEIGRIGVQTTGNLILSRMWQTRALYDNPVVWTSIIVGQKVKKWAFLGSKVTFLVQKDPFLGCFENFKMLVLADFSTDSIKKNSPEPFFRLKLILIV